MKCKIPFRQKNTFDQHVKNARSTTTAIVYINYDKRTKKPGIPIKAPLFIVMSGSNPFHPFNEAIEARNK